MEKQFNLLKLVDNSFVILTQEDYETVCNYGSTRESFGKELPPVIATSTSNKNFPHFKLSDIGIDDGEQLAIDYAEEMNDCYSNDLDGFKTGYNKAKEKYKYTESDLRNIVAVALLKENEQKFSFKMQDYIDKLNKLPTKVWLEMEFGFDENLNEPVRDSMGIKVDKNNYVKVLRYE